MVPSTIAAIATPIGIGGIGIIRISGPSAFDIGTSIFRHNTSDNNFKILNAADITSHFLYYGYVFDSFNQRTIDEVLAVFMKSPRTYTREDIVEIHAHAGEYSIKTILELIYQSGATPAQPGEFTKRAFLNGRIDLTQSEAVIDILNAQSALSMQAAISQISGGIKEKIHIIRENLLQILTQLEAVIDFPDDVTDIIDSDDLQKSLRLNIIKPVSKLLDTYREKRFIREGIKIVIAGAPNVGKSSLMNQLIQKDRSIVTSIPGTTRDLIKEHLVLNDTHTLIFDTAGIQDTDDPVEKIGIQRAKNQISAADIILFIIQAGVPVSNNDQSIYEYVKDKKTIIVINKSDLTTGKQLPELPVHWNHLPHVSTSALYGDGIDTLKTIITDRFLQNFSEKSDPVLLNLRHKIALEKCLDSVLTFNKGLADNLPCDLLTIDIQEAINTLNEITGENVAHDILDRIFNSFCIGK